MIAKEIINSNIPTLKTSDSGQSALEIMDTYKITHLPIVNNNEFLGLISESDIYDLNMLDEPIGNHELSLFSPYVFSDQHIFDLIGLTTTLKLSAVPVLKRNKKYVGLVTTISLFNYVTEIFGITQPGGVIVLKLNVNDYSLLEITQIVEGNDARVLSLFVHTLKDSTSMELTLKINMTDLSSIIQSFNRYGYDIKSSYVEEGELDNLIESRFDEFMKYLSI